MCILRGKKKSIRNEYLLELKVIPIIRRLDNYRPISLLSHIYKLFTRIMVNRLKKKLNNYQTRVQAGFWSGFNTCEHFQALKILIEKCNEYQTPIIIVFVDYEKAVEKALAN